MEMKFAKNNSYGTKHVFLILISVIILLLTGCSSNERTNSINEDTKEEATDIQKESEEMEFDLETVKREGFMIHGTPSDTVPDGYIGIFTSEDLKRLSDNASGNYILMNDIDVQEDNLEFENFSGTFNGNFHRLMNQKSPLFSAISGGNVSNLVLTNVNVEYAALANAMYKGWIDNCFVTGSISGEGNTAGGLVAGISLAHSDASGYCSINNCYNMVDIKSSREAGRIVGKVEVSNPMDTTVYIAACENYGQISGNEGIGGILGSFDYIGKYEKGMYGAAARCLYYDIYNCFNYASVGAEQSGYAGGIAGEISVLAWWEKQDVIFQIRQCANYGNTAASQHRNGGGICGKISVSSTEYHNSCAQISIWDCFNAGGSDKENANSDGGICGVMETDSGKVDIERCLNIGEYNKAIAPNPTVVNSHEGIITVVNCYCMKGQTIWDGVEKLTAKEIKNPEKLNDFDFSEMCVWKIDECMGGYPRPLYSEELWEFEGQWEEEWEN